MRVLSAQGIEVWDILQHAKIYHASPTKCRENNNYTVDVYVMDGYQPIWCYAYLDINFYSMYNGTVLDYLRSEMSLPETHTWDGLLLFELEIDKSLTRIGHTCNASAYSRIFKELTFSMVKAVYSLRDCTNSFYKVLTPIYVSSDDVITTVELNCEEMSQKAETSTEELENAASGRCLVCGEDTCWVSNNKHFCCIGHKWKHYQEFRKAWTKYNLSVSELDKTYTSLTDSDLYNGYRKLIRKFADNQSSHK